MIDALGFNGAFGTMRLYRVSRLYQVL